MPKFKITYSFTSIHIGTQDEIARAIRDTTFSFAFRPEDLNDWRCFQMEDGEYVLEVKRTLVDEIHETTERAARRKFLYSADLPGDLDPEDITVERIEAAGDQDEELAPSVIGLPVRPVLRTVAVGE